MEDMNEVADVRQPLNFDGKLDSKDYKYVLSISTLNEIDLSDN